MPKWKHDCTKCKFLGQTIGGGKLVDLYSCDCVTERSFPTLIARYGDNGPDYYSSHPGYCGANGHAELYVAQALWEESQNVPNTEKIA